MNVWSYNSAIGDLLLQRALGGGLAVLDGSLELVHLLVELRQLAPHRHVELVQEVSNLENVYLHNLLKLVERRFNLETDWVGANCKLTSTNSRFSQSFCTMDIC